MLKKPSKIKLKNDKPTVKQLDHLCRKLVRLRDKMTCRRCGRNGKYGWKVEWAHFYSRSNKAVRWDPLNSLILCFNCHYNFAHKEPVDFAEWYENAIGEKEMQMLRLRKNGKAGDYRLIKYYLEMEIKKHEILDAKMFPVQG